VFFPVISSGKAWPVHPSSWGRGPCGVGFCDAWPNLWPAQQTMTDPGLPLIRRFAVCHIAAHFIIPCRSRQIISYIAGFRPPSLPACAASDGGRRQGDRLAWAFGAACAPELCRFPLGRWMLPPPGAPAVKGHDPRASARTAWRPPLTAALAAEIGSYQGKALFWPGGLTRPVLTNLSAREATRKQQVLSEASHGEKRAHRPPEAALDPGA